MLDKEINPNSKSTETIFFSNLFNQLKKSESYITSRLIQKNITKQYVNIENTKQIYFPTVYNTTFFPEIIKKGIELNTIKGIIYNTKLDERSIRFYFYTQDTNIPDSTFDAYIKYMLMWIYILNLYGNNNSCSQHLNIFIFLTDFEKKIPSNPVTILAQEQVNTAYTLVCSPKSEIVIYRKEEWFKVFIHETIHNFGFDFSTMNLKDFNENISKLFPINSKFNIYESYCEFWARVMNAVFCSYSILNNKNNIQSFISYCDILLQVERVFSLYQTNKILNYFGMKYENLYKKDDISVSMRNTLYKEKTNVFAYYIITSILLNDYTKFIKWCTINNFTLIKFNKTPRTLETLYLFIKKNYKDEIYIKSLNCIERIVKKNNIEKNKFLRQSLRMTILELN
jgi:hypothetical protein